MRFPFSPIVKVHQPISLDDWRRQTSKPGKPAVNTPNNDVMSIDSFDRPTEGGSSSNEDQVTSSTSVAGLPAESIGLSPKSLPSPAFMMSKLLNSENRHSAETTDSEFTTHGDEVK